MNKNQSELLKLLNGRWTDIISHLPDVYRGPTVDQDRVQEAAGLWAQANSSDPFARGRMALFLRRGFEFPSDVKKEALSLMKMVADRRRMEDGQ